MEKIDHSPLPWTFTYFTKPDGSEIKTPQDVADTVAHSALKCEGTTLWGVTLDEPDEDGCTPVICYTGNGPHSEANARLIVAAINALNITQHDEQIKHMVNRFLQWRLPENFNPDGGISFERMGNAHSPGWAYKREPVGTNLFDATQTEEMIRYLVDGMPR
jgi:hypothetical protein